MQEVVLYCLQAAQIAFITIYTVNKTYYLFPVLLALAQNSSVVSLGWIALILPFHFTIYRNISNVPVTEAHAVPNVLSKTFILIKL